MLPAYCTNVVAGRTLEETCANVERTFGAVRALVVPRGVLPVGLWLSARASSQLAESVGGAASLRDRLADAGLAVVALNAFPYHDFHGASVKQRVYEPHWADTRRALYTAQLAELLPDLVPPGTASASISTVPLGWRARFSVEGCGASAGVASALLEQTVRTLARVEERTGVRVTVDLEPEPGCMLDRAADVTSFFAHVLVPRRGEPDPRRYIGVCHDACHAAVMFEDQRDVLRAYRDAGIGVHRLQVSSALACDGSPEALAVLASFDEPRWLHQTCVRGADGAVTFFEDLGWALSAQPAGEWRTHFHVPVFAPRIGVLGTTQACIGECLRELASWPQAQRPLVEVETYAWDALPAGAADGALADGIAHELRWCADEMARAGFGADGFHEGSST